MVHGALPSNNSLYTAPFCCRKEAESVYGHANRVRVWRVLCDYYDYYCYSPLWVHIITINANDAVMMQNIDFSQFYFIMHLLYVIYKKCDPKSISFFFLEWLHNRFRSEEIPLWMLTFKVRSIISVWESVAYRHQYWFWFRKIPNLKWPHQSTATRSPQKSTIKTTNLSHHSTICLISINK